MSAIMMEGVSKTLQVFENGHTRIVVEPSEIPWLKIFAKPVCKEFSDCDSIVQTEIFRLLVLIEKAMLDYFSPTKINIASFGNLLPEVHWHIMARFESDSYFPEPMWGKPQRKGIVNIPPMEIFLSQLRATLG